MKEITVQELKAWKENGHEHQLIDVREQHEYDEANLEGTLIPLGEIMDAQDDISREGDVVFMCRSGKRSAAAIGVYTSLGYENLINLKGGILAWQEEIEK